MSDVVVDRLRRCLIGALESAGHDSDRPLKVAAIYQDLIPYGAVRSEIGVELNADYEHALLRLLAGEGGMLRVEQAEAREALRKEVDEPYPFVGLYRKFAGCDVRVESLDRPEPGPEGHSHRGSVTAKPPTRPPGATARPGGAGPEIGTPAEWLLDPEEATAVRDAAGATPDAVDAPGRGAGEPAREPDPAPPEPTRCPSCRTDLPSDRSVRFCPQCGVDQRALSCGECSEAVEPGWRFCISCGAALDRANEPRR